MPIKRVTVDIDYSYERPISYYEKKFKVKGRESTETSALFSGPVSNIKRMLKFHYGNLDEAAVIHPEVFKNPRVKKARKTKRKTTAKRKRKSTTKPRKTRTKKTTGLKHKTKRARRKKKASVGKLTWMRSIYPYPELNAEIRDINKALKKKGHAGLVAIRPSMFTGMKAIGVSAANEKVMKYALKWLQEIGAVESAGSELRRVVKAKRQKAT